MASIVPSGNSAIVDLSGVEFVASMGIRMLVFAALSLRVREAKLAVFAPRERVREVFESVALAQIIPICEDEADALVAVTPAG